ncbi:MAG: sigma 54-interacting transcriptional regulator [Planctomycetes bacterium]|nr:sigma 54-interacting transcriptional regulator [Planctomycetota bacterium]
MELDFRKNPALLSQVIDAMADGVFTVDLAGQFASWSAGAERITGWSRDEIVGQPCATLEGPGCKGFGKIAELLADPRGRDGIQDEECRIVSKDGRPLHLLGNLRLLRDPDSRVRGAVGTFADLTAWVVQQAPAPRAESEQCERYAGLVGRSKPMLEVLRRIELAAQSDVSTLLRGESGTGKELAARAIHGLSARSSRQFVAINVAAVPESLLESELFGHMRGSFTGAVRDKQGVFEEASGGTLFLDEIGELPPALQAKLLRVLQERRVRRVGDSREIEVDVRLVCATHRNLKERIEHGQFREDFYYRVRVFEIELPPLRERRLDIPLLAQHFVDELAPKYKKSVRGLTREALECLVEAPWPGNVRELRNAIEHALVVVTGERVALIDLPTEVREARDLLRGERVPSNLPPAAVAERATIASALDRTRWNRTVTADLLGISRMTLWKKMKKYGLT